MIFVTGGTGLLGSHLLYDLTSNPEPITALYRSNEKKDQVRKIFHYYDPENSDERFNKIEWIKGDILDIPFLEEVIQPSMTVYHCAGLVSFHHKDFNKLLKVNREGTANIVNVCLDTGIRKLCHVSSTSAIGRNEGEITTELINWKKTPHTSGYSISKYSAEKEVWRGIEEGLEAVIVNPCVILGSGNWNESSLSIFKNMEKGSYFYPTGSNATVDARDVSAIMIQLTNGPFHSERYLCTGTNQSFKELMQVIAENLGVKTPKKPVSKKFLNFLRRCISIPYLLVRSRPSITKETIHNMYSTRSYDSSKIINTLNYKFHTLDETIKNSIDGRID